MFWNACKYYLLLQYHNLGLKKQHVLERERERQRAPVSYVFAYVNVFVCMCISMSSFVWFYGFLMHFFKQVNVQLSGSKLEAHCADGVNVVDSTNDY